ncbi:MAG: ATP-binding cassette domain-containing protein [Synechococcaceae cyanobacterium SM2_3_1]|nr:ATP-binding cassette domain-containing protein [Synechococcaceae cyanobacterium SM2_3_1]
MKVELRKIWKRFAGVVANQEVSFTAEAGTIHGLLGENGAGKSTLVKILSGNLQPDQGLIFFDENPVDLRSPADALRAGVGMLTQDPLDIPVFSVLDNFLLGQRQSWRWDRQAALQEFQAWQEPMGFHLSPEVPLAQLSVGERQQLEILRLLALGIKVLILDEPTTGISLPQKAALFQTLRWLVSQGGTIIFVSHKLTDVEELCDQVTVLRQGRVVARQEKPYARSQLIALMFDRELEVGEPIASQRSSIPRLQIRQADFTDQLLHLHIEELGFYQGEVVGLAGLEGNGQHLFLRFCAGLLPGATGQITYMETDLSGKPYSVYFKKGIRYVPGDRLTDGLVAGLTLSDHLALLRPQGMWINRREIQTHTQAMIDLFQIRGQSRTQVEQLSGGNQQRLQLALLSEHAQILLLEHPTRGLDLESCQWIWDILRKRCQAGATVVFASADLEEILRYSDRVMVFSGGAISAPRPTQDLTLTDLGQMISGSRSDFPSLS